MYLQICYYKTESHISDSYPKLITGLTYDEGKTYLHISSNQHYTGSENILKNGYDLYRLIYIQRQQIYSIDKSIGQQQLTKITLDEPLDYNISHSQSIQTGLQSDNYDYDRVYIYPIDEFDSDKTGNSYIKICNFDNELYDPSMDEELSADADGNKIITRSALERNGFVKIINYVAKTGEVTLYSKLDFMPNSQYMYQIYTIINDTTNLSKEDPEFEFITGTQMSNGVIVNGMRYFLGGSMGSNYHNSFHTLRVYSNHTSSAESSSLFIQPNIGIREDYYKPCSLQVYKKEKEAQVYITNSCNEITLYDPDVSIDTLDDSQWLVKVCSDPTDGNILGSNELLFPQTKYKIYTNFVDSIPEGYFYVRSGKQFDFEYYNAFNNSEQFSRYQLITDKPNDWNDNYINYYIKNGKQYIQISDASAPTFQTNMYYANKIVVTSQDFKVKCHIYDATDTNRKIRNSVPIKCYQYILLSQDQTQEIEKSELIYDGRYEYVFKGVEGDNNIYYVKLFVEDELGKQYEAIEEIQVQYTLRSVNDTLMVKSDCKTGSLDLSYLVTRQIPMNGDAQLLDTTDNIDCNSDMLIDFTELEIPNNFDFVTVLKMGEEIFNECTIKELLSIENNDITYQLLFDTRPYLISDDNKYSLNNDYLTLKLQVDNQLIQQIDYTNFINTKDIQKSKYLIYGIQSHDDITSGIIDSEATTLISNDKTIVEDGAQEFDTIVDGLVYPALASGTVNGGTSITLSNCVGAHATRLYTVNTYERANFEAINVAENCRIYVQFFNEDGTYKGAGGAGWTGPGKHTMTSLGQETAKYFKITFSCTDGGDDVKTPPTDGLSLVPVQTRYDNSADKNDNNEYVISSRNNQIIAYNPNDYYTKVNHPFLLINIQSVENDYNLNIQKYEDYIK